MAHYIPNTNTLKKDDSFAGAPIYRAKYRCLQCSNPIAKKYVSGPGGHCFHCGVAGQDLSPINEVEGVGIYLKKDEWGDESGSVIDDLEQFSNELLEAKDCNHTEKMANILSFGIETNSLENYDTIVIPPSSSSGLNHMIPKAKAISNEFNIPFEDAIVEINESGEMKQKGAAQRRESAEENYYCETQLTDERVLILDDILTTCNTAKGVARACDERGATQISVVSMARNVDIYQLKEANLIIDDSN
jgi:predicted amidophosphoribosyltransferase